MYCIKIIPAARIIIIPSRRKQCLEGEGPSADLIGLPSFGSQDLPSFAFSRQAGAEYRQNWLGLCVNWDGDAILCYRDRRILCCHVLSLSRTCKQYFGCRVIDVRTELSGSVSNV